VVIYFLFWNSLEQIKTQAAGGKDPSVAPFGSKDESLLCTLYLVHCTCGTWHKKWPFFRMAILNKELTEG
jgi:hypothetical protein